MVEIRSFLNSCHRLVGIYGRQKAKDVNGRRSCGTSWLEFGWQAEDGSGKRGKTLAISLWGHKQIREILESKLFLIGLQRARVFIFHFFYEKKKIEGMCFESLSRASAKPEISLLHVRF